MLRKIAGTFFTKSFSAVFSFLIAVILSQKLGASGKGMASLFLANITVVLMFANILGGAALIYLVPRKNVRQLMLIAYIWTILINGLVSILLVPLANGDSTIWHLYMLSVLNSFISINQMVLAGKEEIKVSNFVNLAQVIMNFMILFFLLYSFRRLDILSYFYSLYAGFGIAFLISLFAVMKYLRSSEQLTTYKELTMEMFILGVKNQAGHLLQFLSFRLSYYLLVTLATEKELGVYSNGVSLIESIWLISNSFALVQYSRISNLNDASESAFLTERMLKVSTVLCLPALFLMSILPEAFYTFVFGHEFIGVKTVILILAPGCLMYNLFLITGHYFSGQGRYLVNTTANLLGLVVTVILSLCLMNGYGMSTAALVSTISYAATAGYILFKFYSETSLSFKNLFSLKNEIRWGLNKILIKSGIKKVEVAPAKS